MVKPLQIVSTRLTISTRGTNDFIDITGELKRILAESSFTDGQLTVFIAGSTAAITTFEYEPGLIQDLRDVYHRLAPSDRSYHHDETWGDANGFSHVRAALQGPMLIIPFEHGQLMLGTWQQVVVVEFDTRPRTRELVIQLIGTKDGEKSSMVRQSRSE